MIRTEPASPQANGKAASKKVSPARRSLRMKFKSKIRVGETTEKSRDEMTGKRNSMEAPVSTEDRSDDANIVEELGNLSEDDFDEMSLQKMQKYAKQWIEYHNIRNFRISAYKRLTLQFKLETWRKEALQIIQRNMSYNREDDCMLNFSLDQVFHVDDLKTYEKLDLIAYLYYNSKGTTIVNHAELQKQPEQFIHEQVMLSLNYSRAHEDEIVSIEDTITYIVMSDMEKNESEDISFLQMHVRNWFRHKKMPIPDVQRGDCREFLASILDEAREELPSICKPFNMDPETKAYVERGSTLDKDGDQIMDDGNILQPPAVTPPKARKVAQKIDQLNPSPKSAATSMTKKVISPDIEISLTSDLSNEDIEKANLNELRYAFHKHSLNSGEEIPSSAIEKWDHEFLKEACRTKRNNLQLQEKMLQTQKATQASNGPKSALRKSTKLRQTKIIHPNKTKGTCRYSIHFTIPATYKGTEGLRQFLSLILTEMIKYGDELCILPWATDEMVNPISDVEKLPTTITGITKYFEGARSPEASTQLYMKVRLGYSLLMEKVNFDADVQGWCKAQSIRMYQCSVQHPNVRSCGWLVYAPRSLNQQKWCQQVMKMYESKYDTRNRTPFQVGLTWRALNGQYDVQTRDKVRAMHIDAPVEVASRVKNFLRILEQKKKWPMQVRFRVMDEFHKYMKESTKQKYRYMVAKHTSLLAQLGQCECSQIVNLDKQIRNNKMTLRDVILNIRDKQDGHRIYASIDEKWNSDTMFVATYRPDKSNMAYDFMTSLSTYVKFLFPDSNLKRILTPQALDKANDESCNPSSQTFTTQDDIDLDREIQADLDDDSMEFAAPDDLANPFEFDDTVRLVGGDSVWDLNDDADTVSTNQPSGMGNVSFDSATCRMYDSSSCASSVNSTPNTKTMTKTSTLSESISEEIYELKAASKDIDGDESEVAGEQ